LTAKKSSTTVAKDVKKVQELKKELAYAEAIINTVREPLLVLYPGLQIRTASKSFYKIFKVERKDTEGKLIFELGNGQWNIPLLKTLLNKILKSKTVFSDFEVEHHFEHIGHKVMLLNARKLDVGNRNDPMILLAIEDITEKKSLNESVETERKTILENIPSALIIIDKKREISYCNKKAEIILGKKTKGLKAPNWQN